MTLNNTPALDFTRRVAAWQEADGASAGLPMLIPDRTQRRLDTILADLDRLGPSPALEERARGWLVGYQELEAQQQTLTPVWRAELDAIVSSLSDAAPASRVRAYRAQPSRRTRPGPVQLMILVSITIIMLAIIGSGVVHLIGTDHDPAPQGGTSQPQAQNPPPAGVTDLQRLKADWDVPAAASASAGNAQALVYLDGGLYYITTWTVPAGDAGWAADASGTITAQPGEAGQIQVTDTNGTTWSVWPGQPFAVSSNPQSVFRVTAGADVESMPVAHAVVIRHRI